MYATRRELVTRIYKCCHPIASSFFFLSFFQTHAYTSSFTRCIHHEPSLFLSMFFALFVVFCLHLSCRHHQTSFSSSCLVFIRSRGSDNPSLTGFSVYTLTCPGFSPIIARAVVVYNKSLFCAYWSWRYRPKNGRFLPHFLLLSLSFYCLRNHFSFFFFFYPSYFSVCLVYRPGSIWFSLCPANLFPFA